MSSRTYIIAWDKALENCLDIDRQLSEANLEYTFFNVSSDLTPRPNWVIAENVRYYGHFYNALKDFLASDAEVFGFNAGDPRADNYAEITKKAENVLQSPGIYAPNLQGDFLSERGVYLEASKAHSDLYLATQTNGICVYLHRTIAETMYKFMYWMVSKGVDFSTMHSGWGLDTAYCTSAIYLGYPIYRDSKIYVDHPPGSSYQTNQAGKDMMFIDQAFDKYVATELGWDVSEVKAIREKIFYKARRREEYGINIRGIYPEASLQGRGGVVW